ncbi:hypothetical protein [Lapidilactobacillus wuchangensis]|uniref:hypothetical protein n=1 Tax=Lapidilactobacillus wuchangensis TaxID=2486001 RepID=UPI000F7A2141|nr:hypothetical protein [Lapidilactobacillus wuchangensis]
MAKLAAIAAYKTKLGYSNNTDQILFVQSNEWSGWGAIGISAAALANALYYLSFEDNGLLFMQIDLTYQFKDVNQFIPYHEISSLVMKKEKFHLLNSNGHSPIANARLCLGDADNNIMEFSAQKFLGLPNAGWVHTNYKHVKAMIDNNEFPIASH